MGDKERKRLNQKKVKTRQRQGWERSRERGQERDTWKKEGRPRFQW